MSMPAAMVPRPMDTCILVPTSREADVLGDVGIAVLAGHPMLVLNKAVAPEKSAGGRVQREGLIECAHIPRSCQSTVHTWYKKKGGQCILLRPCKRSRGHDLLRGLTDHSTHRQECCSGGFYLRVVSGKRAEPAAPCSHCASSRGPAWRIGRYYPCCK
jgi:hypothetical protein